MMEKEIWSKITGYPDYKISNRGRVKSVGRWIQKKNKAMVWFPTKILKPFMRHLYKAVNIYQNKNQKTLHIHRLVALHFVENPDPNRKTQVNHLDTDKLNNYYKNLRWDTPKENTEHAIENNVFCAPPRGEKNGQSILKEADVRYIRSTRYIVTRKDLAKKFGVSIKHIDRVRCGERWGHVV